MKWFFSRDRKEEGGGVLEIVGGGGEIEGVSVEGFRIVRFFFLGLGFLGVLFGRNVYSIYKLEIIL